MLIAWTASFFILILEKILSLLPDVDASVPVGIVTELISIISDANVIFPLGDFVLIMGISFAITNFQIIWKIMQRIWDALPMT